MANWGETVPPAPLAEVAPRPVAATLRAQAVQADGPLAPWWPHSVGWPYRQHEYSERAIYRPRSIAGLPGNYQGQGVATARITALGTGVHIPGGTTYQGQGSATVALGTGSNAIRRRPATAVAPTRFTATGTANRLWPMAPALRWVRFTATGDGQVITTVDVAGTGQVELTAVADPIPGMSGQGAGDVIVNAPPGSPWQTHKANAAVAPVKFTAPKAPAIRRRSASASATIKFTITGGPSIGWPGAGAGTVRFTGMANPTKRRPGAAAATVRLAATLTKSPSVTHVVASTAAVTLRGFGAYGQVATGAAYLTATANGGATQRFTWPKQTALVRIQRLAARAFKLGDPAGFALLRFTAVGAGSADSATGEGQITLTAVADPQRAETVVAETTFAFTALGDAEPAQGAQGVASVDWSGIAEPLHIAVVVASETVQLSTDATLVRTTFVSSEPTRPIGFSTTSLAVVTYPIAATPQTITCSTLPASATVVISAGSSATVRVEVSATVVLLLTDEGGQVDVTASADMLRTTYATGDELVTVNAIGQGQFTHSVGADPSLVELLAVDGVILIAAGQGQGSITFTPTGLGVRRRDGYGRHARLIVRTRHHEPEAGGYALVRLLAPPAQSDSPTLLVASGAVEATAIGTGRWIRAVRRVLIPARAETLDAPYDIATPYRIDTIVKEATIAPTRANETRQLMRVTEGSEE